MNRPTVLVVDQDPELREVLSRMLAARGYEVLAAESRAKGFDLFDEHGPELLILDDPSSLSTYRMVWLKEDAHPDVRVELVDLQPERLSEQLEHLLDNRRCA